MRNILINTSVAISEIIVSKSDADSLSLTDDLLFFYDKFCENYWEVFLSIYSKSDPFDLNGQECVKLITPVKPIVQQNGEVWYKTPVDASSVVPFDEYTGLKISLVQPA